MHSSRGFELRQIRSGDTRMSRKKENLLELLIGAPWWINVVLAILSFIFLRWIVPAMLGSEGAGKILGNLSSQFSTWISLLFALMAAASGLREILMRRGTSVRAAGGSTESTFGQQYNTPDKETRRVNPLLADAPVDAKPLSWSVELLRELEWKRFEVVGAELFRELGFRAEMLSKGPDGGIDVKLYKDSDVAPAAIVQCKSWKARQVGIKPLREFLGVMTHEGVKEGIYLAAFDFTQEAVEFAKVNRIDAVDGKRFIQMINTLNVEAQQKLLRIATEGDYKTPSCPSCGVKLVHRSSSHGSFWGCANYPRCKFKLNIA